MALPYLLLPPDQEGYSSEFGTEFISVKLSGGQSFFRRDKLGEVANLSLQWKLTEDQFQYFMAFYRTTLKGGSLSFSLDLIVDRPDARRHTCHFLRAPTVTGVPGLMRIVSAQVEAVPEFENTGENTDTVGAVNLATNLIARIRFYENVAKDYGPFDKPITFQKGANNTTIGTIGFAPDGTLSYDNDSGSNSSYLSIGESPISSVAYTIMVWFYVAPNFETFNYLVFGDGGANDIHLYKDPAGGSVFCGHATANQLSSSPVSASTWHHAAMNYDQLDSQRMRLYIDGVQVDTDTAVGTIGAPTFMRLLGDSQVSHSTPGYADDLLIFRRVLTPLEILDYYNTREIPSR